MDELVWRCAREEAGATAIEYGLIAAPLGVGLIAALPSTRLAMR